MAERRIRHAKALQFSKCRSLWPLARILAGLSRGTSAIISESEISLGKQRTSWRRGWDSNPRYGYPYNGFRDRTPKRLSKASTRNQSSNLLSQHEPGRFLNKSYPGFEPTPRILERDDYGGFAPPLPDSNKNNCLEE